MKYYKIIKDNTFLGIITSNNFIRYQDANNILMGANEETGDLVDYNNHLYRALWMKPMNPHINQRFEIVDIINISQEEYNNFYNAIRANKQIIVEDKIQEYVQPTVKLNIEEQGVDFIRSSKLNEMSYACRKTIEAGFDFELRGETKHFSLATQDQLNLMSLGAMAQTQSLIPYHADGEECDFYTAEEINEIIDTANAFKIYHTTYYNALKGYINSLETIEDIAAVTYGMEIPEEYQTNVLKALEA